MLRQGAQHALLLCAEACWLAPNTMPWMHCSTPCWLVQYCQCADWRAGCASPRVAREAREYREARLSVNPARRGAGAPRKLLDRRLHCERRRRYSNFPLPIKSARPLLFSRRNLARCFSL